MNESRRRIMAAAFWSGLSSFFTLKWLQAATSDPELAARMARAQARLPVDMGGDPKMQPKGYDADEVLMVAMGGTLPNQRNTCYYRGNAGECTGDSYDKQHKVAWHSTAAPEEIPDGVYPRLSGFAVATEMLVGTIDEICEDFKQKLIAARQTIREVNTPELNECFGYCSEHQVTLKALRDQYKGSNPAAAIPEDHAGMVRKVLERQAELDKQAPSMCLPLTKPQMVWLCNYHPGVALMFMAYGVEHVWVVERDSQRTKLRWSVVFDVEDPGRQNFDRDEQGLCLIFDNPNPWTDPESMSKELFKPGMAFSRLQMEAARDKKSSRS